MLKDNAYRIRSVSVDAVVACVLGGLSFVCMIGAILTSYVYSGKGPAAVGLLGIGSLMAAFVGIGFSVAAWKSQEGGLFLKRIAMIVNIISLLIAIVFYVLGWVL